MVRSVYATFVRNWTITLRAYPWSFFIGSLLTGSLTVALAYFLYHLLAGGQLSGEFTAYAGTSDYMSYVILGAGVFLFAERIMLGVSRSMITERREGTLESLLLTPTRRFGYLIGVTIQWAVVSVGEMVVMLLVTWPLGLNLSHIQPGTLIMAVPVALVGLFGLSLVLGAIMLATGDTYLSQNTLFLAMFLVCGITFPPNYLPLPLQWLGAFLPVTGVVRLLRDALLYNAAPSSVVEDAVLYLLLGLAYAIVGLLLMRWAERRAVEGVA